MAGLAAQHQAVNLAQGFTDEGIEWLQRAEVGGLDPADSSEDLIPRLEQTLEALQNPHDTLNQYSFRFGLSELSEAISSYMSSNIFESATPRSSRR
jgi:hypothetical protein